MTTAPQWHDEGPMVALDTETTGVDPLNDRIVTAAIVHHTPGSRPRTISWLINPGVDVPAEAAAVHGWTNDRIERALTIDGKARPALRTVNGQTRWIARDGALAEIAMQCAVAIGNSTPLVVHNAAFDCTLLEAELTRNGVDTLTSRPKGITGVVDPMVIERQYDPYRRVKGGCRGGKFDCRDANGDGCGVENKTLTALCEHYRCPLTAAHSAGADALAALRLARRLPGLWAEIARLRLPTLHEHQIGWRREQSDSLRSFWQRQGDERWREVDAGWPLHSALTTPGVAA